MASRRKLFDQATDYAKAVTSKKIVACELVRLACQRHLHDIATASARGLYWVPEQAQIIYDFYRQLRHSKGRWAGQPFELHPWECFFTGSVWGWRRKDGTRRFRQAHMEVGRKNGKTTVASGLGLALSTIDNEAGCQVYTLATKLDQARITHEESKRMVLKSPSLKKRIEMYKNSLIIPSIAGQYSPLGRDSDGLDGLDVSGAIADEIHAWRNRDLWDVIETATGARTQPLLIRTTTAGFDTHSLWWELRQHAVKMLKGDIVDDELFALIYTLDDGDDWKDESTYIKANPNLGVTLQLDELVKRRDDAIATPGKQPSFRRRRLNQLTESAATWIDMVRWDALRNTIVEKDLIGRRCFAGLDFSSSQDLTAAVYLFPLDRNQKGDLVFGMVSRFWVPEDGLVERCDRDGVPYDRWAAEGWISLVPGPAIRYEWVEAQLLKDAQQFEFQEIAADRAFAVQTLLRLQDAGFAIKGFGQGFFSMAPQVVEFERCVVGGRFRETGNPVLRWCVANTVVDTDPAGNRKPTKKKSTGRIDGVVAALMALGIATAPGGQPEAVLI